MSTNQLPLRWTRIVSLSLLAGVSFTTSQLCLLMFELHMKAQIAANQDAPAGVEIAIKYNGVQSAGMAVFAVSGVIAVLAVSIVMCIIQDTFHIIPGWIARRLKITGKTLSTSTFGYQVVGLALSTILLVLPLSFLTVIVFTKGAQAEVTENGTLVQCPLTLAGTLDYLCVPIIYADTPYIRIIAELPWAMVLLCIFGTLVTFVAWCRQPGARPILSPESSTTTIVAPRDNESKESHIIAAP